MLTHNLINNVNTNLQKMEEYQNQIASGKKINKPSDDPIANAQLLITKSAIKAQEQYFRNMEDASGWLDTTDGALAQANDVLQRVRELAVAGSNGTLPEASMTALAEEVDNLVAEMVQIANTNYAGRYIFGGGKTSTTPFTISGTDGTKTTAVQFVADDFNESWLDKTYQQKLEIESGVTINVAAGRMTFHTDTSGNDNINAVFDKIIQLRINLNEGDQKSVSSLIDDFDKLIDNVLSERAVVGAKVKRMESALERSSAYGLNLTKLVSKLEDADYAEAATGLRSQQTVYEASLAIGAKIIQPSLIDFLK
jgi:flagellar hook-associated protein 3 FlgL